MKTAELRKSILKSIAEYEQLLNAVSEEEFVRSPAPDVWSYSEVFSHILQANLGSLIAIEKCICGTGIESAKRTGLMAWLILFFGRFPPVKLKVPEKLASSVTKMSCEEARNLIIKFKRKLDDTASKMPAASPFQKIKHPRLGLLNAFQWLRFIEVHTKHHQKQLGRVKNALKN